MRSRDKHLGTVIAQRRLHVRGAPRRTVVVSLGKPRPTKGEEDWNCPFRIAGAGIRVVDAAYGVDAFQALTLSLEGIRHHLDRLDTPLVWDDMLDHSAFQRVIPLLPVASETKRLERFVEREVIRRYRVMIRRRGKRRARQRTANRSRT
jgi:hypothetical protein